MESCTINCPDGSVFKGVKVEIEGKTKYYGPIHWPDGKFFDGEVRSNGEPKDGLMSFTNGSEYEGTFPEDPWTHEQEGTTRYKNGDVYKGTYGQGLPSWGKMSFANGDVFEGTFLKGKPSNGKMTYSAKTVEFRNGKESDI